MQSSGRVASGGEQGSEVAGPGLLSHIPAVTAEDVAKKRLAGTLLVTDRRLRTPSPLLGANCDEDSEAESFRDGRTEEVDRDTRASAFAWCRDFLSGSWKSLREEEFEISIVR